MSDVQSTSINRSWLVKMLIFTAVLVGFGLWSLYDATILYPNRGNEDIKYKRYQYLDQAQKNNRLPLIGSVGDPVEELAILQNKQRSGLEDAKMGWLIALSRLGQLKPEGTLIEDPVGDLAALDAYFKTHPKPEELSQFEMPLQWTFVVIGFGGGLWIIFNIVRSVSKRYRWDEATQTLTLPGGKQVTPALLADVDKRRWHKFFCTLTFTDGTPPAALDLLKYNNLEGWILAMEHTRFPERAAEAAEAAAAAEASETPVDAPPAN